MFDTAIFTIRSERWLFQAANHCLGQDAEAHREPHTPGTILLPSAGKLTREVAPVPQSDGLSRLLVPNLHASGINNAR